MCAAQRPSDSHSRRLEIDSPEHEAHYTRGLSRASTVALWRKSVLSRHCSGPLFVGYGRLSGLSKGEWRGLVCVILALRVGARCVWLAAVPVKDSGVDPGAGTAFTAQGRL